MRSLALLLLTAASLSAAGILADYAAPVLDSSNHIDAAATLDRVANLHANTYYVLIHSEADWERLKTDFLPAAVKRNLEIWTYFVPPSECSETCHLPFDKDYIRIAAGVAELSLKFPNLKGLAIDDFMDNTKLYTPEYVGRMRDAGRAVNPKFQFMPLLYWRSMKPEVLDQYATVIDGVIFAYRDEPTINTHRNTSLRSQLDQAEGMLRSRGKSLVLMIYCAPLGRIPIPPSVEYVKEAVGMGVADVLAGKLAGVVTYVLRKGTPSPATENYAHSGNGRATLLASGTGMKVGDHAELTTRITAASNPGTLTFWRTATYTKMSEGYFSLQIVALDKVLWEQDLANIKPGTWSDERVEVPALAANTPLHVRLAVKKNTGSIAAIAAIDDLSGIDIPDSRCEIPRDWIPARRHPR